MKSAEKVRAQKNLKKSRIPYWARLKAKLR